LSLCLINISIAGKFLSCQCVFGFLLIPMYLHVFDVFTRKSTKFLVDIYDYIFYITKCIFIFCPPLLLYVLRTNRLLFKHIICAVGKLFLVFTVGSSTVSSESSFFSLRRKLGFVILNNYAILRASYFL
jgi:hypothetical protein